MKDTNKSDFELVNEFIQGNNNSIEILINRHRERVYTYILLMVKKQALAEDIFQDTFIKVIDSLRSKKYHDEGRFVGWVLRIAHNLVIDFFRKKKNLQVISNDDYESDLLNSTKYANLSIEDELVKSHIHGNIRQLIKKLPDEQRQVVVMRYYLDMSFKEISAQTNVSTLR